MFIKAFEIGFLIGLPIAFVIASIDSYIQYQKSIRKHGKETVDEMYKRWR